MTHQTHSFTYTWNVMSTLYTSIRSEVARLEGLMATSRSGNANEEVGKVMGNVRLEKILEALGKVPKGDGGGEEVKEAPVIVKEGK
jgi:hypothetical protein